jgi:hypothetical protein
MHKSLLAVLMLLAVSATSAAAVLSNERFAQKGVGELADSLLGKLLPLPEAGVTVLPVEGPLGSQMVSSLAARIQSAGLSVFLVSEGGESKRPVVKATVDDYHLTYEGIQRGVFSQGKVVRQFDISGSGQLLEGDGRLIRVATVGSLFLCDTLSYADARFARGNALSPKLPATPYERLVEPGLVLGITGALVYLFFASR